MRFESEGVNEWQSLARDDKNLFIYTWIKYRQIVETKKKT